MKNEYKRTNTITEGWRGKEEKIKGNRKKRKKGKR
jgi:hypothetical protein